MEKEKEKNDENIKGESADERAKICATVGTKIRELINKKLTTAETISLFEIIKYQLLKRGTTEKPKLDKLLDAIKEWKK